MPSKEEFDCKYNLDYKIVNTMYIFQSWKDNVWKDIDSQRGCAEKAAKRARYLMRKYHTPIRTIQVKETTVQTSDYKLLEVLKP